MLYQIQTKYRDEARPRAGILRVREFVMKDSYSFDIDDAGLKTAYHAHREAYQRIFDRLQVRYVIVSAVSGAMGGSASEEFLAESPIGEDTFVRCPAVRLRRQRRGRGHRPPGDPADRRAARAGGPRHRRHPDHRHPGRVGQRRRPGPHRHRRRHLEERPAQGAPTRWRVGATGLSAYPETARSTTSGWARRSTRPSTRCSTTPTSPSTRFW